MTRLAAWVLLLAVFLTGCWPVSGSAPTAVSTSAVKPRTIIVFAAASLKEAFTDLGAHFEAAHPQIAVTFNFAGSQTLRAQIEEGAPADVFASASGKEMDALVAGEFVAPTTAHTFLHNQLVVILPADNPAGLSTLADLANSGVKLVLAAEEVPVGHYTRQSLGLMAGPFGVGFNNRVLANVVSNEDNVKQVVVKVQLGEADAGIVYTSDAVAAPELKTLEIPPELNVIAHYPIAALTKSTHADLAQAFVAYVLSPAGQAVLQKWGFVPAR